MSQTNANGKKRRRFLVATAAVLVLLVVVGGVFLGHDLLAWSIRRGHTTIARALLVLRLSPDGDGKQCSPLCDAVSTCRPAIVRLLLERGADPRRVDANHHLPLGVVFAERCSAAPELVSMLLDAGADTRDCPRDSGPLLATHSAVTARALLEHGADPNQSCSKDFGGNALNELARYPEVVALLLDHGAKIVAGGPYQQTPLHDAADLGRKDFESQIPARLKTAQLLLDHGADVNAVDKKGRTPLDIAYEHGDKEMADILIKHGGKSKKHDSPEAGEEAADSASEYDELYSVAEGVRKGPACSLSMHGDNRAIMEEGPNWSIIQGTVGVVRVNCHAGGYFHYAVLGMGSPVPKRLNMPLSSGPTTERITFDKPWSNGVMHFYYSAEPIKNLVRAINRGDATHFAVRHVNVGK